MQNATSLIFFPMLLIISLLWLLVSWIYEHIRRRDIIYYVRTFCKERFYVQNQLNTPLRGVRT